MIEFDVTTLIVPALSALLSAASVAGGVVPAGAVVGAGVSALLPQPESRHSIIHTTVRSANIFFILVPLRMWFRQFWSGCIISAC